jgi:hypothetical protein
MDTFAGSGKDPVTLHKYLYANINPVSYTDPSGRMTLGELGTVVSILGTGYSSYSATTNILNGNYTAAAWDVATGFLGVGLFKLSSTAKYIPVRQWYIQQIDDIAWITQRMEASGAPGLKILEYAVNARNKAKFVAREMMLNANKADGAKDVAKLAERNMKLYGNPYGPDLSSFTYSSMETFQSILQSALRSDPLLNALFIAW